jgi:hypothetical protein
MFHADVGEKIEENDVTATVRYETYDADEVEVGDVADAVLPDGKSFASLRITRTVVLPIEDARQLIDAFDEQYPADTVDELVDRVNRYYEHDIDLDSVVRVITFEKVASTGIELDERDQDPTLEDYKAKLRDL